MAGGHDRSQHHSCDRRQLVDRPFTPTCAIRRSTPTCATSRSRPTGRTSSSSPPGYYAGTLCDATSRWPTAATGTALQPTWVDYTGGDTIYTVAVTGTAIYAGGHDRWFNNPFAGDRAGPGAVPREGIAALDPVNGFRSRGILAATEAWACSTWSPRSAGLWVGSDTDQIGGETHRKLAFFPTAGGTTVHLDRSICAARHPVQRPNGPASGPRSGTDRFPDAPFVRRHDPRWFLEPRDPGDRLARTARDVRAPGRALLRDERRRRLRAHVQRNGGRPAQQLDLHGLTNFPVASITGMFYANGGIYYTVKNDAQMYFRYFTPESRVVGADRFVVSGNGDGLNWSTTRGLTLANGKIYFSRTNSNLSSMTFGTAPVPGTETLVSPATAGTNWASGGLFVFSSAASDTTPPTVPGQPTGQSPVAGSISISWAGRRTPHHRSPIGSIGTAARP